MSNNGPGILGFLLILFVALKLTGFIHWSWFWVLAPVGIPLTIILGFFAVMYLVLK